MVRRSGPNRNGCCRSFQRPHLGLLVDADHHGLSRRTQVQADDVADLALEFRVGGELERLRPPRLQAEAVPDPGGGGVLQRCPLRRQCGGQ